ncbi:MAG: SGNH/GDSL hydrolase family protein, partial [Lachnospiraceae bacterium]
MKKKFLIKLTAGILILTVITAGIVIFFDPFFHYHKPIRPLKAVLTQAEYQVIGTLRNFDYDALIVGSSMAENYNNHDFDEAFGCTAIKAVKPAANTADLLYLIEEAYESREIKKIFYTLDISALTSSRFESTFLEEGMPIYLYNKNPLDDIKYLFNKDILFKEIPYMIATSLLTDYDEGDSYNWAQYKDFSIMYYEPTDKRLPMQTIEEYGKIVDTNVEMLMNMIRSHPETEFTFIVPPYSSLWWYEADMKGESEADFYALDTVFDRLLEEKNVSIYYFQHLEDIMANLDLYMDVLHFHPDVNDYILEAVQKGEHRLAKENKEKILEDMQTLSEKCITIYAKEYFADLQE